ncbi:MAG: type 4a pilus biogenesis protein PilO [Patescibacteria group bacterium]|jgi:Tfp pilus assembly protein PilO
MKLKLTSSFSWLIGAVVIAICFVLFAYFPLSSQLKNRTNTAIDKRNELIDLQEQVQNIGKQQGETELDQKQTELNRLLIPKQSILEFLSTIEEHARTAGVTETLSFDEFPASTATILKHPISLTVTGQYDDVIKFLRSLEGLDYYVNFKQFSITHSSTAVKPASIVSTNPTSNELVASDADAIQLTLAGFAYWH